jgi:hypothetical protein
MNESLPPASHLIFFAVGVPAAVVALNMPMLWAVSGTSLATWVYPSLVLSVAVLSGCSGTYLRNSWLGWLIFAWSLTLLDLLTFVASSNVKRGSEIGYVLVSAEISLLVLWGILGPGYWQWRLAAVAAATPLVAILSSSFPIWTSRYWNDMMILTAVISIVLCGGLRFFGFVLCDRELLATPSAQQRPAMIQFGMKHVLIWLTVTGPLILILRSVEIEIDHLTLLPELVLSLSIATVNLVAIWAVLGGGHWIIRIAALLAVPFSIGYGLSVYSGQLQIALGQAAARYGSIAHAMADMKNAWIAWMWLDAALLASLLLFARARGFRLMRTTRDLSYRAKAGPS